MSLHPTPPSRGKGHLAPRLFPTHSEIGTRLNDHKFALRKREAPGHRRAPSWCDHQALPQGHLHPSRAALPPERSGSGGAAPAQPTEQHLGLRFLCVPGEAEAPPPLPPRPSRPRTCGPSAPPSFPPPPQPISWQERAARRQSAQRTLGRSRLHLCAPAANHRAARWLPGCTRC